MMDGLEVGKVRAFGGEGGNLAKMVFHDDFHGPVFFGYTPEQSEELM